MTPAEATCWTLIRAAAAGDARPRDEFARRYAPVLRAYFAARWLGSRRIDDADDAVQDVFVECFRPAGALAGADAARGGFRAYLYGIARHIALRRESRRPREQPADEAALNNLPDDHTSLSRVFDRAWAKAILREAARLQEEQAQAAGDEAVRRVELLRLRFHEGRPIRDIARMWGIDAAALHHEYAKARQEFRAALRQVVAFHHPRGIDVEAECANLLSLLR